MSRCSARSPSSTPQTPRSYVDTTRLSLLAGGTRLDYRRRTCVRLIDRIAFETSTGLALIDRSEEYIIRASYQIRKASDGQYRYASA